ncbi:hypothetical protein [Synechocystis sp. LKSZ1]|uniref:hypothetical protein n=1 Tax=Synechocystis sp. LKSZ1 TaxID=3144951 RepID=UPI00336C239F
MVKFPAYWLCISNLLLFSGVLIPSASAQNFPLSLLQAQAKPSPALPPAIDDEDPNELRPLGQSNTILSIKGGQKLMEEANQAINSEKYALAQEKLQQARKIFNQLSNLHLQLANSFQGINPAVFEEQRNDALKSGQLRDEATYRLALVHRAANEPELAVPLLIQIIRSQNPSTELGRKSYQQLYELGFVATPFALPNKTNPTPPSTPK